MKPLEPPTFPGSQADKKMWIDYLDYFINLVNTLHKDQEIKAELGLDFLTDNWCNENKYLTPIDLMNKIKSDLSADFELTQVIQEISDIKRTQFQTTSVSILKNTFQKYQIINNSKIFESDYNNWFIHGDRAVIDKSAFAENQGVHNLNFDSFLAESLSNRFARGISDTFYHVRSNSYLVKPEDLFSAIDKLNINDQDFLIINFGINIPYYKEYFSIQELDEKKYKNCEIIKFDEFNHQVLGEAVFIMRKSDLPHFNFLAIESEQIEKFSLIQIDAEYNIFTSIIPLNSNDALRKDLKNHKSEDELLKSVLICISFKSEIRWAKNIKSIMIQTYSPFRETGLSIDIKDINPFE